MTDDQLLLIAPEDCHADAGVILGYRTGRPIPPTPLRLGRGAIVRSGSVIYQSSQIGDHLETGHNVVIREENVIGDHFAVWNNTVIDYGCVIGNNVRIHCNCYIAQFTTIEDDVFITDRKFDSAEPGVVRYFTCLPNLQSQMIVTEYWILFD